MNLNRPLNIPIIAGSVRCAVTLNLGDSIHSRLLAIGNIVAPLLGWNLPELMVPGRTGTISWARQLVMYVQRETTPFTLSEIGRFWGRDHTTVMYTCKLVKDQLSVDRDGKLQATLDGLCTSAMSGMEHYPGVFSPNLDNLRVSFKDLGNLRQR